ncbi:hypothetical protein M2306_001635 [Myroides gitamensis]|uniref:hypothetical protein n=1 Tax=Myroides odoratus TaxID=256 RepID=UPI0021680252|nr:hypothetical protein [Myroides odoratus]MCS4238258.1 hypothetical protein [Myroides odoratus]MDH6600941.1 hypothetical protein [Myroides gitamensis]
MKKILHYITLWSVLFSISTFYGQINKSTGTRITDNTIDKELRTNAILDLDSTSKGFYLPRMTTAQRDALLQDMSKDNGLAVYNIDNDCVEYWSARANKWMSLCGTLPPAELDIEAGSCSTIIFNGFPMVHGKPQAQQGIAFKPEEQFISLRLKVNQVGTYTISVISDNGYFFSGEGQFQAIGTYQIILKGMGTPVNGYEDGGDTLKFIINGKESTVCTNTEMLVIPADLKYTFTSTAHQAQGKYYVGAVASAAKDNKIQVNVKVIDGGLATIKATNAVVGLTFEGTKMLTSNTVDQIILEPIAGQNTPLENIQERYALTFAVNTVDPTGTIGSATAEVVIAETKIDAQFDEATFGTKPYYQEAELTEEHTIKLPVKVIGSGKSTLYLKGAGGIVFKAEDIVFNMPAHSDDLQEVTFKAVAGTLPKANEVNLTLSGGDPRFTIENGTVLRLPLTIKPVQYTLDCTSIKTSRGAMPYNKPIGEQYTIQVTADVTVVGEYEINTDLAIDGILFSTTRAGVKQAFTTTGKQEVTLYAVDGTKIPTNKGEYTVGLVANDTSNTTCSQVKLKVGYNDINILVLFGEKSNTTTPRSSDALFFTGKNSSGKHRFGAGGEFTETGEVTVTTVKIFDSNFVALRAQLVTDILAGKYNFILISGQAALYGVDSDLADALYKYVTTDQGVLWLQSRYYHANRESSINYVSTFRLNRPFQMASIPGGLKPNGYDLIKQFNGGNDLIANNYGNDKNYNMIVANPNEELTKARNGYEYKRNTNGKFYDIHWYMARSLTNFGSIDGAGSSFRALLADRGTQFGDARGLIFAHKTHKNMIWAPIAEDWFEGTLTVGTHINANGEPFHVDQTGNVDVTNIGAFIANIWTTLMERIANK